MIDTQQYLKDLEYLCSIDSGKGNARGTGAVADWFEERYRELGLRTERHCMEGHENLPVLFASNTDRDILVSDEPIDVLFIAHMDTVFDTQTVKGWPLTVDDKGIGHGPGCVDCKGGCLLVYYILKDMLKTGEINFRFCAAYNSDEETGSLYSRMYFEELAERTSYCLVFEPGRADDEYVGIRKGGVKYLIKAHGIAAHSGVDFAKGANAVNELAKWVTEIEKLVDLEKGTTACIAKFNGGLDNGQVPDYAELLLRILYLDEAELDKVNALIERMKAQPFDNRCSIEVEEIGMRRPPLFVNNRSEKLLEALKKATDTCGTTGEWIMTGGMSDGNWVAHHGAGTLDGCGPCGGCLHTTDEYIKVYSIDERYRTMRTLLAGLF